MELTKCSEGIWGISDPGQCQNNLEALEWCGIRLTDKFLVVY